LNLITNPASLAEDKVHATTLLEATEFKAGSKYADHQSGDKTAEYGLAGLVAGGAGLGAAVKLGLFAKLGKILLAVALAGKKLIVIAVVGAGALLKRLFSRGEAKAQ
jgi:uncharacterized membrane-anchored protein